MLATMKLWMRVGRGECANIQVAKVHSIFSVGRHKRIVIYKPLAPYYSINDELCLARQNIQPFGFLARKKKLMLFGRVKSSVSQSPTIEALF